MRARMRSAQTRPPAQRAGLTPKWQLHTSSSFHGTEDQLWSGSPEGHAAQDAAHGAPVSRPAPAPRPDRPGYVRRRTPGNTAAAVTGGQAMCVVRPWHWPPRSAQGLQAALPLSSIAHDRVQSRHKMLLTLARWFRGPLLHSSLSPVVEVASIQRSRNTPVHRASWPIATL